MVNNDKIAANISHFVLMVSNVTVLAGSGIKYYYTCII